MAKHHLKSVDSQPDFPKLEKQLLAKWYQDKTVDKYLHQNDKAAKKFFFQDGPITANNPMGVHHAWGRTYKDLWQRYKNMQGFKQRFQNGFDCQGLWVEVEVEKELGFKNKKDIEKFGIAKFIQLCKDRVKKFSDIQTQQSQRLGYFMDWDNSYFTMSDANNYMIWHFLKRCFEEGFIYKGHDSVPWCPRCGTAISQHEMLTEDYKDAVHESIFFALPVIDEDYSLLVWTTTPWTIPANVAVAIHPDWDYAVWEHKTTGKKIVILDSGDFEVQTPPSKRVFALIGDEYEKFRTFKGTELLNKKYTGPFDDLPLVIQERAVHPDTFHTVVSAKDLVTAHEGTGLVHIAPGAGSEDFAIGKAEKLSVIAPINEEGDYYEGFGFLSGSNAKKHPELVIDYLKNQDFVIATHQYRHRYPACWRCKTELMWRVVDEWYIGMDRGEKPLRERMKAVTKKINWIPDFGLDRELDWLNNMHDWLISKKRYWGLALPIWVCEKCNHFEVIGGQEELKARAIHGYDNFVGHSPHRPFIDEIKIKCDNCGGTMSRIPDVGNPWLDAGIVPFSTLLDPKTKSVSYLNDNAYFKYWFPADFVTESFPGQFKNWFYSLIAMSTVLEDAPPFLNLLGFSSMLGEDGRPMHKSWGNSIEFNEGADKLGVDVMRWIFARHNPTNNLLFGPKLAQSVRRQFHLMLWNSYRFFVNYADLDNWSYDPIFSPKFTPLDDWILSRLHHTLGTVTQNLDKFAASPAAEAIEAFVNDLSLWYIRRSRDRLGPNVTDSVDKNTAYTTLYHVFETLGRILMPFTPFLADLIYTNVTGQKTVHTTTWPMIDDKRLLPSLENSMAQARQIVEIGHNLRKVENIPVRQPLSDLTVTGPVSDLPPALLQLIKEELNVEEIKLVNQDTNLSATLNTTITEDLKQKGQLRDLLRSLQEARKLADCRLDEVVDATLPEWPKIFEDQIKHKALIRELKVGDKLSIIRL